MVIIIVISCVIDIIAVIVILRIVGSSSQHAHDVPIVIVNTVHRPPRSMFDGLRLLYLSGSKLFARQIMKLKTTPAVRQQYQDRDDQCVAGHTATYDDQMAASGFPRM